VGEREVLTQSETRGHFPGGETRKARAITRIHHMAPVIATSTQQVAPSRGWGRGTIPGAPKHPILLFFRDPSLEQEYLDTRAAKNYPVIRSLLILFCFTIYPAFALFLLSTVSKDKAESPELASASLVGVGIIVCGTFGLSAVVVRGGGDFLSATWIISSPSSLLVCMLATWVAGWCLY